MHPIERTEDMFSFTFQEELVTQNLKAGILVSRKNLVLQRVHRTSAGNYTCTVNNEMGTTTSSPVPLAVRCEPIYIFIVPSFLSNTL